MPYRTWHQQFPVELIWICLKHGALEIKRCLIILLNGEYIICAYVLNLNHNFVHACSGLCIDCAMCTKSILNVYIVDIEFLAIFVLKAANNNFDMILYISGAYL